MKALLAVALILLSTPAQAQVACGEYNDFVKTLATKFHEKSVGKGIAKSGTAVFELFVGRDSFTVLSVTTGGQACIVLSGNEWIMGRDPTGEDT